MTKPGPKEVMAVTATAGVPAKLAERGNALRSNCLFPISLGLLDGERARRSRGTRNATSGITILRRRRRPIARRRK